LAKANAWLEPEFFLRDRRFAHHLDAASPSDMLVGSVVAGCSSQHHPGTPAKEAEMWTLVRLSWLVACSVAGVLMVTRGALARPFEHDLAARGRRSVKAAGPRRGRRQRALIRLDPATTVALLKLGEF
jgi:hypothetical protein